MLPSSGHASAVPSLTGDGKGTARLAQETVVLGQEADVWMWLISLHSEPSKSGASFLVIKNNCHYFSR